MIVINLKGGTGNQLFQYAPGRHLAIKNNDTLKLDINGLERANKVGDIYRPFQLSAFAVVQNIATPEEVRRLKYPYGIISKAWRWISFKLSKDKNTLFHPQILNRKGDIYLDGYWQSPLYFDEIRDTLLTEITLKEPFSAPAAAYATQISVTNSVSLHARRGDYVKNPRIHKEFGICSKGYYERAMREMEKLTPSPTYFVFSDDIDWVKENLPVGEKAVFVKDPAITDVEELLLMSMCKHNIIANSSFGWWGAWLNKNPQKVVAAPTPWFDGPPYDQTLIPPTWIQLPKLA